MPMMIMCSKGCGVAINVSDEMLEEAKKANQPFDTHHEVCPNEDTAPLRQFKITTVVQEFVQDDDPDSPEGNWEAIARMGSGDHIEAHTFKEALPKLSAELNEQWNRILGMADIVDSQ